MRANVTVTRRPDIADPQGVTVQRALTDLGFDEVTSVRIDRTIEIELESEDPNQALQRVRDMCEKILTNPVLEDYDIDIQQ